LSDTGSELTGEAATGPGVSRDEHAELERLRSEVTELRERQSHMVPRHRFSWRTPVATVLIVIGCLLAPVSVLGVWGANEISNTNRYIENIEPLIHEPSVQNAITDRITNEITSHLNITGYTNQAAALLTSKGLTRVGTLLKTFGPALSSAVAGFIHTQVHKLVTSARFAKTWIEVNTVAHQNLVNALSGKPGALAVSNGYVTIDLAPFIAIVKQAIAARGFTLINSLPGIHPTLKLFSARQLVKAQTTYRAINDLKIALPILALLLIALGVYLARGHRRALIGAGLGFAASMVLLGAVLLVVRGIYLNSVPSSVLPSDAAADIFDTYVRFIRAALRTLLVLGLVVAIGAFLTGPSVTAVRTRGAFTSGFAWIRRAGDRGGVSTGPVGRWTYAHRTALRVFAVGLAAIIFVFWGRPTAMVVILLAVLLVVVLGLIELIGRPEPATQPR
jgi:hypothetical protein